MTTPFPEIAAVEAVPLGRVLARLDELARPIAAIRRLVCLRYGVTRAEIVGRRRLSRLAVPRHVAFWLALKVTGASSSEIGRAFGRDHTTVLHGFGNVEAWRQRDQELRAWTDQVVATMDGESR